jgi:hypothetical protein
MAATALKGFRVDFFTGFSGIEEVKMRSDKYYEIT